MRKLFVATHKWLSLPVGLIISITCLSGAILVFQDELQEWRSPDRYFVASVGHAPLPLDSLIPMVNRQLTDNQVKDVRIPSDPRRNYAMGLAEGTRITAYVDPYTAEVKDIYSFRKSPFYIVMSLHRWMLDDTRTWGKYSVGISTLIFVFILISGLIIWFPKKFKKSKFTIKWRKGTKRLLHDLHTVLGAYAFLLLFIGAVTGLMWSFDWYRNGVFRLFGAEIPEEKSQGGAGRGEKKAVRPDLSVWQVVADNLAFENPNNEYIRIQDGSAAVHLKNAPNSRATDKYDFDKATGEITDITYFREQEKSSRVMSWAYALHVGNYWGIWSKILTFIAGLIGATLPLTGYYMWWKKRKKKRLSLKRY